TSVVPCRSAPVAVNVSFTCAPATTAPLESVTCPRREVVACPQLNNEHTTANAAKKNTARIHRILVSSIFQQYSPDFLKSCIRLCGIVSITKTEFNPGRLSDK